MQLPCEYSPALVLMTSGLIPSLVCTGLTITYSQWCPWA